MRSECECADVRQRRALTAQPFFGRAGLYSHRFEILLWEIDGQMLKKFRAAWFATAVVVALPAAVTVLVNMPPLDLYPELYELLFSAERLRPGS